MSIKRGFAKIPAPLSSIFSPKIFRDGELREDPIEIGAVGGGFALANGVETIIELDLDGDDSSSVLVNDSITYFPPSIEAAEYMRRKLNLKGSIRIRHKMGVPIATGFGTSAASTLGVILILSKLSGRGMTLLEACRITHEIELKCKTGLNSEAGILSGGLILVLREGAPPKLMIDSIPLPSGAGLVAVVAGVLETTEILKDVEKLREIEEIGDRRMEKILERPIPENFLEQARAFAWETGFITREVEEVFEVLKRLPTIGYAQNMLGKAAHALVEGKDLARVESHLRETFPDYRIISSRIGYGVRIS